MQWTSAAPNAGFTTPTAVPWLPVPPSARNINVETESAQRDSLLNFYKRLLKLRRAEPALMHGDYLSLNESDPHVFSFLRRMPKGSEGRSVLVALNMSNAPQNVSLGAGAVGGSAATVLESNYMRADSTLKLGEIRLPPFGAVVAAVR